MQPKNILFIGTDQQRLSTLNCYGHDFAVSPNIDRLALEGVRFTDAYTASPVCSPSRTSTLLGVHVPIHGIYENGISPHDHIASLTSWFDVIKGQGYSFQAPWHFKDQPYYPDGVKSFDEPTENIVDALSCFTEWLSNSGTTYQDSYYYKTVKNYFPDEEDARSFALRLIIHYAGDIHQPLHASALVDS